MFISVRGETELSIDVDTVTGTLHEMYHRKNEMNIEIQLGCFMDLVAFVSLLFPSICYHIVLLLRVWSLFSICFLYVLLYYDINWLFCVGAKYKIDPLIYGVFMYGALVPRGL